ncbi:hypothetical protein ESZ36_09300 [Colwellia demingiae]|uniref:Uncharacterized protein n=1 Tax=Colwellia demingiae TaxID=89401 RepID=A0A5C6QJ64_9GAMM|nr:hypothetical protein [Colwellia demingiae]TWX68662.1 hypothetical protein ESZ36_09300 [Colwellia demingiae]
MNYLNGIQIIEKNVLLVQFTDRDIELSHDYTFINFKEKIDNYSDVDGYLYLINGLNKTSIDSSISSGINSICQLDKMKDKDILSFKDIGSVSLKKLAHQ